MFRTAATGIRFEAMIHMKIGEQIFYVGSAFFRIWHMRKTITARSVFFDQNHSNKL